MRAGIELRGGFSAGDLRRRVRQGDDADHTRRVRSIAVILDARSRSDAARTGGVGLQVIRDWALRFNEGGPEALRTRKAPGNTPILTDEQLHLLAAGAHAILIVDQAGRHVSPKLEVPDNITLLPLPPRSPEVHPVENVWQFIRQNWLSNRVFKNYEDIVALCREAWNKLIDQPDRITSIGWCNSANGF